MTRLAAGHQLGERRAREELEHHVRLLRDLADLVDDDDVLVAARGGVDGGGVCQP